MRALFPVLLHISQQNVISLRKKTGKNHTMMTDYKDLCTAIEQELRRTPSAPSDFKWISEQIEERTRERVSASTLMRLWGYMEGVTPRRVTLDILARFLGYMGYEDFMAHQAGTRGQEVQEVQEVQRVQGVQEDPVTAKAIEVPVLQKSKPRWTAWAVGIVAVVALVIVAGSIRLLSSKPSPVYVTDLSQLSNTKQYIIHTLHDKRGLLGVNERHLATTYTQAAQNRCEEASPFAIIQHEGSYYLFSVEDKRFIEVGTHENDAPLAKGDPGDCSLDIHQEADSCFVIDFKNCKTVCSLNINSVYGPFVTDYGTINGMFDEGNLFMLEEAGNFDPTEALAMMEEPNAEYTAALETVTPGQYFIFTENSTSKRFYLRADGNLTDTSTDSCLFTIQIVENKKKDIPPYRLPAWCIIYETGTEEGEEAHSIGFGCPHVEGDTYVPCVGHLRTDAANGNGWQDKVLFLGSNGCYAIRATNLPIEAWGAGLYWAVYDTNNDGLPEADYSQDRSYVWHLERQER